MKLSEAITKYGDVDVTNKLVISHISKQPEGKPELKKIDMSHCIESRIDIEIYDDEHDSWDICRNIWSLGEFKEFQRKGSEYRPRMNHIHACPNGLDECPLPAGFAFNQYFLNNNKIHTTACISVEDVVNWNCIIAFEVTGIAEGYTL